MGRKKITKKWLWVIGTLALAFGILSGVGVYQKAEKVSATTSTTAPSSTEPFTTEPFTTAAPTVAPSSTPQGNPLPTATANCTHIFTDRDYNNPYTGNAKTIYANGGKVKEGTTTTNKKQCTLYTDILASYNYTLNSKGTTKYTTGKVIAGITLSDQKPTVTKNKIVDSAAAKIAKASIKNGTITITAQKESGLVYLWVIDTGRNAVSECCPIVVATAPTKLKLYDIPYTDSSFSTKTTKAITKGNVEIGADKQIYLYPSYTVNKTEKQTLHGTYTATVDKKAADYFSVTQTESNPYCFTITAKKLKSGKKVSGKITFACKENGKKVTFTATAINSVKSFSIDSPTNLSYSSTDNICCITPSAIGKVTGSITVTTTCSSDADATTDTLKLYAMGNANGYDATKLAKGKVSITRKPTMTQKKLTAKLQKDKKTITISAAKKTPVGTSVYYLLVYHTKQESGYKVIQIRAE